MFDHNGMGQRRSNRGRSPRTDAEILAHSEDVFLLGEIAAGRVTADPAHRMALRGLAREELVAVGFSIGSRPDLLPRGRRILAAARGELARPTENL